MSWRWVPDNNHPAAPMPTRHRSTAPSRPRERPNPGWVSSIPACSRAGVRAVSLYEADRLVYGPMSLEPEI